jgi:hypothetical protein
VGSQDLGGIGFDESMEFGGMDQEISMGDFGEEGLPLEIDVGYQLAGVPPSPAISELAPVELDLESYAMPARIKAKKRKRAYVPQVDETTEMSVDKQSTVRWQRSRL